MFPKNFIKEFQELICDFYVYFADSSGQWNEFLIKLIEE